MPRRILRPREAQARLGVGHTKFSELVNEGKLRLIRIGPRAVGIEESELDTFIENLPNARPAALEAK
jgi:excisionase family DNA binding protein